LKKLYFSILKKLGNNSSSGVEIFLSESGEHKGLNDLFVQKLSFNYGMNKEKKSPSSKYFFIDAGRKR